MIKIGGKAEKEEESFDLKKDIQEAIILADNFQKRMITQLIKLSG